MDTIAWPLADVLSITTGRLLSRRRPPIDGVCELLTYMTGERTMFGDQLEAFSVKRTTEVAHPELLRQHPWLVDAQPEGITERTALYAWLVEQERVHGESIRIAPLPRDGS
ncbi:hypothetical protein [Embleya sp. NPDC005971]|uniref:DUF7736 domain-containing protein n=1 Tax=Embleya sp. NPDC005971 TaxID=3156724 RepID=UPI00340D37ED